jgi:hypothetical protein
MVSLWDMEGKEKLGGVVGSLVGAGESLLFLFLLLRQPAYLGKEIICLT